MMKLIFVVSFCLLCFASTPVFAEGPGIPPECGPAGCDPCGGNPCCPCPGPQCLYSPLAWHSEVESQKWGSYILWAQSREQGAFDMFVTPVLAACVGFEASRDGRLPN